MFRYLFYTLGLLVLAGCAHQPSAFPNKLPNAQTGHAIWSVDDDVLLLSGFENDKIFGSIWKFSNNTWDRVDQNVPFSDRTWFSATYFPTRKEVLVFGGKSLGSKQFDQTWIWKNGSWNEYLGKSPTARSHHSAIYDPSRDVIVLFGGDATENRSTGEFEILDDTWEWDGASWKKIEISGPPPRAVQMAAYDPIRKLVVIAGGVASDNETRLQDTWGWDGEAWTQLPDLPSPLAFGATASDENGVVIYGGWQQGYEPVSETLRLNTDGWRIVDKTGAPAMAAAVLHYDQQRNAFFLSGGMNSDFESSDNVWELTTVGWVQPSARSIN